MMYSKWNVSRRKELRITPPCIDLEHIEGFSLLLLRCRGEQAGIGPDFPPRYVHVTFEMCVGLPSRGLRRLFAVTVRERD